MFDFDGWKPPKIKKSLIKHVTPAVYPRVGESRHIDIQSTGQKSVCDKHHLDASQTYVLIIQLDSPP